nr:MAG TPA: hypothetical protein [Caudoviricetes sp.]
MFYMSQYGDLIHDGGDVGITAYARQTLEKFPNILKEWFEEIKEPTDSIHWKPKRNEKIWYLDKNGDIVFSYFNVNSPHNRKLLEFGEAYRTLGECARARERILAEVRLRRTSTFKPDFKNGNGGWIIGYDYYLKELTYDSIDCTNYGEPVRYETEEDAERSIKENREDWLIYFGIEEEK